MGADGHILMFSREAWLLPILESHVNTNIPSYVYDNVRSVDDFDLLLDLYSEDYFVAYGDTEHCDLITSYPHLEDMTAEFIEHFDGWSDGRYKLTDIRSWFEEFIYDHKDFEEQVWT